MSHRKQLLRNGKMVIDRSIVLGDLLIDEGRIVAIANRLDVQDADVVDVGGDYVLPGLIDLHVHIADQIGGNRLADDFDSGSRIAVLNGVTTLWSFITESTNQNLNQAVNFAINRANRRSYCDYGWHLTPIRWDLSDWHKIDQWIERGFRTFKFYTTYKQAGIFSSAQLLEDVFAKLSERNCTALIHCEDDSYIDSIDQTMFDYSLPKTHTLMRPKYAEVIAIRNVLTLARKTHVPLHIVHVSTVEGAAQIFEAKRELEVTSESCPQYFTMNDSCLQRVEGHRWLCSPPLRDCSESTQLATLARDGVFDIIATDHCAFFKPHKDAMKHDIRKVPNGLPGIGALPHAVAKLSNDPDKCMMMLGEHVSYKPAQRLGILRRKGKLQVGADADIAIFKQMKHAVPMRSTLADVYDPWIEFGTNWQVSSVWKSGVKIVDQGEIVSNLSPSGEWLCPSN